VIPYTKLKSSGRHDLREVVPLRKPYTVLVEPSSFCNFRCAQCFQGLADESYFTRTRMNMPLTRFTKVVQDLKNWPGERHKVVKLSLYGEPLLSPFFCDMLQIVKEAGVAERVEITTNASLLTQEIAERLVELQLDYLRVSIYAPDQQHHETITGSSIAISRIRDNLGSLKWVKAHKGSEKPFVSAKMLDMYDQTNDLFEAAYRDVVDEVYIDKPHSWIKVAGADFLGGLYGNSLGKALSDLKRHSDTRVACPMAFTTMAIRANGDVSPCCVDFIGGTNLGNVDTASPQEIWNSDRWFEFQKMQLEGRKQENSSCARCDICRSEHYTRDNIDGIPVERLRREAE